MLKKDIEKINKIMRDYEWQTHVKKSWDRIKKALKKPLIIPIKKGLKSLTERLEERAFKELGKEIGQGDHQWARGILYAINCIDNGKLHDE